MTRSQFLGILGVAAAGAAVLLAFRRRRKTPVPVESDTALPPCIFCNNESGSEEHLWPDWVHRFIKANNLQLRGLRVQEGTGPETIQDDLEITINTVCNTCNNTWMSRVEDKNRPRFLLMLQNEPITVDPGGMKIIAEWAVLRAIMQDSKKPSLGNDSFYTREERTAMRERLEIPTRTRIWFGALDGFHLGKSRDRLHNRGSADRPQQSTHRNRLRQHDLHGLSHRSGRDRAHLPTIRGPRHCRGSAAAGNQRLEAHANLSEETRA